MKDFSSHKYPEVYAMLGVDTGDLGCIMIDTEPIVVSDVIPESDVYMKPDQPESHTQGYVSEVTPHVTLLYGLMSSGPAMKLHVDEVLKEWGQPAGVTIDEVTFFYGNPEEPNVVIVAKIKVTDELQEGNARLRLLPHIDTFPKYHPHITLAYVKDSADYAGYVKVLNDKLSGQTVKVVGLNYGD